MPVLKVTGRYLISIVAITHHDFLASGKGPLDVVTDLAAEYVMNVGRTLKFLSEQHSDTMSSEVCGLTLRE